MAVAHFSEWQIIIESLLFWTLDIGPLKAYPNSGFIAVGVPGSPQMVSL